MIKGVTDTLCCIKIASNLTDIELKHVFFLPIHLPGWGSTNVHWASLLSIALSKMLVCFRSGSCITHFFLETADWCIFVRAEIRSFQRSSKSTHCPTTSLGMKVSTFSFSYSCCSLKLIFWILRPCSFLSSPTSNALIKVSFLLPGWWWWWKQY